MGYSERNIVILGGTGGIGSAVARRLSERGAELMVAARGEEGLARVADETGAHTRQVDATRPEEVDALFEHAADAMGGVDAAINCVGSILIKPAHRTGLDEWEETKGLNLDTAFYTVQAAAKRMQRDGGAIVLVSTAAAQIGLANHDAIAAVKAGVEGLTRSAAATYAGRGIRVNCVAPGLVETPLSEPLTSSEQTRKFSLGMHPVGRLGKPEDIASAIDWLVDDEQSWVSGQVLGVDGGLATMKTRG